jgi:ADP-ribose pyrophosphatase
VFRVNCPSRPGQKAGQADFGTIQFSGGGFKKEPAKWMHLADSRAPHHSSKAYASAVLNLMEKHWAMSPASVLISITGGAQDFLLPPRLNKAFRHGLAKAAQATNAWVFTGGTDSGVMQLVGQAIAEYNASVQCIGVVTWGVVLGRNHLQGMRGGTTELAQVSSNSVKGANLEPNHTHFLLVDSGKEGDKAWGGEIAFRFEVEKEYCLRRKVPRVLLVVQGGPGTLASILAAIEGESPVVLVRDSGGVATLLDHFLKTYKDPGSVYYKKGEIMAAFEKSYGPKRDMLAAIAALDDRAHKVSSFGLTENSTAELDLHLLNAVINDESQVLPHLRLRLAVEWNRKDVVERVLRGLRSTSEKEKETADDSLRGALQCAIEHGRVQIIKLLLAQNPSIVSKLDFLALYRTENRIFLDSPKLWQALVSDEAMRYDGVPTPILVYRSVLLPFLEPLVPGMHERLKTAERTSYSDLLLWAVCVGDLPMAQCFWEQLQRRGDPVRMALLASQVSMRVSAISQTEANKYAHNAMQFEQWACAVLDKCHSLEDAMLVLMRPHQHWPDTILRLAIDGENKNFVGHRYVQMIVDECWRGNSFGSMYALPQATSWFQILIHLCFPRIDMEHLGDEDMASAGKSGAGKNRSSVAKSALQLKYKVSAAQSRHGTSKWAHLNKMRVQQSQANLRHAALKADGGACVSMWRGLRRCVMRILRPHSEEGLRHFFKVPRVKFTFKLVSYVLFLLVYFAALAQRGEYEAEDPDTGILGPAPGGPHLAFTWLDLFFYAWAFTLWLEEMHQWAVDSARGMSHVSDMINIIDVVSLFALLLAFLLRVLALGLCHGFDDDGDAAYAATDTLLPSPEPLAPLYGAGAAARQLHGGGSGAPPEHTYTDPETHVAPHVAIWRETYHDCDLLYYSQMIIAINAIPCFYRLVNYLTIWRALGVLYVILVQVSENIAVWITLFSILLIGFSAASLGLMPSLGGGAWTPSGAFFLPWWAMYGEFGELSDVSAAGSAVGTAVLWTWAFCSQILLVNILIAMMTETYEKVKKNADNEWRYTRVFLVDEFAGTVYDVPSPISMPFLLRDFGHVGLAMLRRSDSFRYLGCLLGCCADEAGSESSTSGIFDTHSDLLTTSLKEEELSSISQAYPDRIMQADLMEEQELSAKGDLIYKLTDQQEALDKVFAKELENQEIIMHIDKMHTASLHMEQLKRNDSAKFGTPHGSSTDVGELRAQLKIAREETIAARTEATDELKALRSAAGSHTREVGKLEMEREIKDKMIKEGREELSGLQASLRAAQLREEALLREKNLRYAAKHAKARTKHPAYPPRSEVPDDKVSWRARWPDYKPVGFTHAAVHANNKLIKLGGWADPPDCTLLRNEWNKRVSFESSWSFDPEGRPLNPRGRTGMCERGLLGKWGANQAADPIVTRLQPKTGRLQMVAILRKDTGDWAIPGGMVDDGEVVSATVRREFTEECGAIEDEAERRAFTQMVDELFVTGQVVYRGYVDDPRNTDNSWMETTAFHFHCNADVGSRMAFNAGDDAAAVRWLDVDPTDKDYINLYASHKEWVDKVAASMRVPLADQ